LIVKMHILIAPALLGSVFALGGCAQNYAAEGALAGAALGAGVGAVTDRDIGTTAAVGAAAGAVGGALIEKNGKCYRRDRDGREYEVSCNRR
jgi:osmotically inducible lipoprotein OsmB